MTKPATGDPRPPLAAGAGDAALVEHRESGEQVYHGALLDVRRDRARMPDGSSAVREYIVHPGAVLVVPVADDGRLVVERQFRYPPNRTFLEFPAGKLDPGESAIETDDAAPSTDVADVQAVPMRIRAKTTAARSITMSRPDFRVEGSSPGLSRVVLGG